MQQQPRARWISVGLLVSLVCPWNLMWAGPDTGIDGRVLAEDAKTPIAGAVVKLKHADGAIRAAEPTTDDGSFRLADLPPGEYSVTVETDEGLYVVSPSVVLEAGTPRTVQMALRKTDNGDNGDQNSNPRSGLPDATKAVIGVGTFFAFLGLANELGESSRTGSQSPTDPQN